MRGAIVSIVFIFTFLVRNGSTETDSGTCYETAFTTLAASNTINGAQLLYKQSLSTSSSVLFDGLNISSSDACGEDYKKCSIFLLSHDDILLSALPLGSHIGLATFNTSGDQLAFLEQHTISTLTHCEISSIFLFTPFSEDLRIPTLLAVCQSVSTVELLVVTLATTNLAESTSPRYYPQCSVTRPSEFVFFELLNGVVVFVNESGILLQRTVISFSEGCMAYEYPGVCSDVDRFVALPHAEHLQAIYCSAQTNLLDITVTADMQDADSGTFSRSEDGLPMFCSGDVYCSYRENQFTLRQVRDRTAVVGNSVAAVYEDEVVWGDCVVIDDQFYAVVQLRNSSVAVVLFSQGVVVELGVSVFPPRIFEHSVVLVDSTHTAIFSLLDRKFDDPINGSYVLVSVVNGDRIPVPCTSTPADVMSTDVTSANVTTESSSDLLLGYAIGIPLAIVGLLLGVVMVVVVVMIVVVCVKRLSKDQSGLSTMHEMNGIVTNELKDTTSDDAEVVPDANVTTAASSITASITTATATTTATNIDTTIVTTTATMATSATTSNVTAVATPEASTTTAPPSPSPPPSIPPEASTTTAPPSPSPPPSAPPEATHDPDEGAASEAARIVRHGIHHQNHAPYQVDLTVNTNPFQEHDGQDGGGERWGGGGERRGGGGERRGGGGERRGEGNERRGGEEGGYWDNNNKWKKHNY